MPKPMSKKAFKEMMYQNEPNYLSMIDRLEFDLFITLQLETRNNIVIDSFTNQPLSYNGKFICYPKDKIQDKTIATFDPFNNPRFMQFIFSLYIRNYQRDGNIVQSFFLTPINPNNTSCAVCRCGEGYNINDISSNYFVNESLRYIDLIFIMERNSGISNTLFDLDRYLSFIKEERMLERKAK